MYQVLKYFPKLIGIFLTSLGPVFLLLLPFLDRGKERNPLKRPLSMAILAIALLGLAGLGTLGYLAETKQQFSGKSYEFDTYGIPHLVAATEAVLTGNPGAKAQVPEKKNFH